ncbi:hypothetical protein LEN26_007181 [Aphanomyces euteiches]|nr:hypothetical protein AeMF1_002243 [Aphanomyces euteiches]KAH9133056.1 hypothetical protein LEN26_007181 [Aphanomyces euteiches]
MEYNVTWGEGSLGLTLRAELGDDMPPMVGRITREDSAAARAGVAVGHLLVSVNGVETARRGYDSIVKMLKTIPRPCTLRFRVPKSLISNRHSDGGARANDAYRSTRGLNRGASTTVDNREHNHYFRGDARSEPDLLQRQQSLDRVSNYSERTSNHRGSGGSSNLYPPPVPEPTPLPAPPQPSTSVDNASFMSTASIQSTPSSSGRPKRETYSVEWQEGPLGMIFRPDDLDCHIPCVRKITGKGVGTRGIEKARVGDILLEINGTSTKEMGFRASISTLKSLQKPAVLKFKRMRRRISRTHKESTDSSTSIVGENSFPPPIPETALPGEAPAQTITSSSILLTDMALYDIVWREGELGLKLKPTPSDVPMISRLTGRGSASGLHNAHVGDVLVTVNGKPVDESTYGNTLRLLKHTPKPVILRFRPCPRDVAVPTSATSTVSSKRDQIPLDVAKQLVATSQGLDPMKDEFAGVPMKDIIEGSKEANYLRVAAKAFVAIQADKKRGQKKADLTRAEREAQVLAEALEQLKEQAKKYEEMLAKQKVERILRPATEGKSKAVVSTANNLFAELKSSVNFVRRDSVDFTDMQVDQDHLDKMREDMLKDLSAITQSTTVIPSAAQKTCTQCSALESISLPFYLDDSDNQWYCETCWIQYYGEVVIEPEVAEVAAVAEEAPEALAAPVEVETAQEVVAEEEEAVPEPVAELPIITPITTSKPVMFRRPSTLEELRKHEMGEEQEARREAEKMLKELEEMRRNSGSHNMASELRLSQPQAVDRHEREKRGKEELARMLQEEEEKAKADGNDSLARKLEAQRKRSLADVFSDLSLKTPPVAPLERTKSEGGASLRDSNEGDMPSPTKSDEEVRAYDDDEDTYDEDEYDQDSQLLQNREDQNFAMAKELQRMHEVVNNAHRMSMMMLGEEDVTEFTGLSDDQVNLFKKLALESDHRVSLATQEYFQNADDSDDDDSDSDEEGDDGVWI